MNFWITSFIFVCLATQAFSQEYLVRFNADTEESRNKFSQMNGGRLELVSKEGILYKWTGGHRAVPKVDSTVSYLSKNKKIRIFQSPSLIENQRALFNLLNNSDMDRRGPAYPDNPEIKSPSIQASGSDPLLKNAWGMFSIDATNAHNSTPQGKGIVVAVTDTGVDYNHADLINNMWRNAKENPDNGIDDDQNGYVDDVVGWDFHSNDNKPYDLSMDLMDILLGSGNPGHGTHVSGVIASSLKNSIGLAGVAPQAKIMALRFIGEKGEGSTESAIKAIDYAVANGANIINASWGGESGEEDEQPLKEAIHRAEAKGVLFAVAAGNGRLNSATGTSAGFDIDSDPKPISPAVYNFNNMIGVAALDSNNELAAFSNWGKTSIKLGAPGVKILSTVPGDRYQDTLIDFGSITATWDGTSMATPFVAGALAALWSKDTSQNAQSVKAKLLGMVTSTTSVSSKVETGGRLDLHSLR
ncbi:MAG: protease [Deltaproteobacteria bacterium]|nr:protease [Deltaproteobacteria bacterium]